MEEETEDQFDDEDDDDRQKDIPDFGSSPSGLGRKIYHDRTQPDYTHGLAAQLLGVDVVRRLQTGSSVGMSDLISQIIDEHRASGATGCIRDPRIKFSIPQITCPNPLHTKSIQQCRAGRSCEARAASSAGTGACLLRESFVHPGARPSRSRQFGWTERSPADTGSLCHHHVLVTH